MIHREATLAHPLLEVTIRELVATVPSDTQQDEGRLEVAPLERGLVLHQEYDSRRMMDDLKAEL
jgi:hypothetical protein